MSNQPGSQRAGQSSGAGRSGSELLALRAPGLFPDETGQRSRRQRARLRAMGGGRFRQTRAQVADLAGRSMRLTDWRNIAGTFSQRCSRFLLAAASGHVSEPSWQRQQARRSPRRLWSQLRDPMHRAGLPPIRSRRRICYLRRLRKSCFSLRSNISRGSSLQTNTRRLVLLWNRLCSAHWHGAEAETLRAKGLSSLKLNSAPSGRFQRPESFGQFSPALSMDCRQRRFLWAHLRLLRI